MGRRLTHILLLLFGALLGLPGRAQEPDMRGSITIEATDSLHGVLSYAVVKSEAKRS